MKPGSLKGTLCGMFAASGMLVGAAQAGPQDMIAGGLEGSAAMRGYILSSSGDYNDMAQAASDVRALLDGKSAAFKQGFVAGYACVHKRQAELVMAPRDTRMEISADSDAMAKLITDTADAAEASCNADIKSSLASRRPKPKTQFTSGR